MFFHCDKRLLRHVVIHTLLSLASLLIFFGIAEALARYYVPFPPEDTGFTPLFVFDREKLYALQPNITGMYGDQTVITNSQGYRDEEIPVEKPEGTLRVLLVGDSVAFGHGVAGEDVYSEQLEPMLTKELGVPVEVINTAVPGNSPFQEYVDLERGLKFQPDLVIYAFVLNDVVEPYWVLRRFGGAGIDYHGIADVPYLDHVLSKKSRAYSFVKEQFIHLRFQSDSEEGIAKAALQRERYSVSKLRDEPENPDILDAWKEAFRWISKMESLSKSEDIPFMILATPYFSDQLSAVPERVPQKKLQEFSDQHEIPYVDLIPVLQNLLVSEFSDSKLPEDLSDAVTVISQKNYMVVDAFWNTYFLDGAHMTVRGHALTAKTLLQPMIDALR